MIIEANTASLLIPHERRLHNYSNNVLQREEELSSLYLISPLTSIFSCFITFKYVHVRLLRVVVAADDATLLVPGGFNSLPRCISYLEILHFKLFPHVCRCFSPGAVCPSSSSTSGWRSRQSTPAVSTTQALIKAVICQPE